jgi:hypothetical protein
MSNEAKYNFGGISKRIGQFKVRVGQGDMVTRIKMMIKEEHTEIDLIEFDRKLTKAEVCEELLKIERFQRFKDVIEETYAKKTGATSSVTKQPKAPKPAKAVTAGKAAKPKQPKAVRQPKVVLQTDVESMSDDLLVEELKKLVA